MNCCWWIIVGESLLVNHCWWIIVGESLLVNHCWWIIVGESSLVPDLRDLLEAPIAEAAVNSGISFVIRSCGKIIPKWVVNFNLSFLFFFLYFYIFEFLLHFYNFVFFIHFSFSTLLLLTLGCFVFALNFNLFVSAFLLKFFWYSASHINNNNKCKYKCSSLI